MKKMFWCILFVIIFLSQKELAPKSSEQIQTLHNKISNDLLTIRKEFPQSQLKVYSILDQECKLYTISKENIDKKKKYKLDIKAKSVENFSLKTANASLQGKLNSIKNDLNYTNQNMAQINQRLEQNVNLVNYMSQEKNKLVQELNNANQEKEALLIKLNKFEEQNSKQKEQKIAESIEQQNNVKINEQSTVPGLSKTEKLSQNDSDKKNNLMKNLYNYKIKQRRNDEQEQPDIQNHQSLSLTSTSDPSSPR